jgi:hypothetical protein
MDNTRTTYGDRIWNRLAQAELLVAEENWPEAWNAFKELHNFATKINYLWPATVVKIIWISAHLKRGEPEDRADAEEMLTEALSEFLAIGADGFVERIGSQLAELEGKS